MNSILPFLDTILSFIKHRSGHSCVVNSRALTLAGITESVPQPEGGHIDKDMVTGRLTGVLREKAAFKPVEAILPVPTKDQMKEGVINAGRLYATAGITLTHDAGATAHPDTYRAYQEAVEEGLLKTRVYLMIHDWPYAHYYCSGERIGAPNRLWKSAIATRACEDLHRRLHPGLHLRLL